MAKDERWSGFDVKLTPNTPYHIHDDMGFNVAIIKNLTGATVYIDLKQFVSTTNYESLAESYGWGIIVRNHLMRDLFLYCTQEISVTVYLVITKNPIVLLQNMTKSTIATNVNVTATTGLKAGELNLDAAKNLGVNVNSTVGLKPGDLDLDANKRLGVNVSDTAGLKPGDLNLDASKNLGVNINNTVGLKPGDLDLDASKMLGVNIKSMIDPPNLDIALSVIRDILNSYFQANSIVQSSDGQALNVTLDTGLYGGRTFLEIFVQSSEATTYTVYASANGINWRQVDTITLSEAGSVHKGYQNAYRYIKVQSNDALNHTIEIVASR